MPVNHTDIPAAPLDLVSLALKSVSDQKLTLRIAIAGHIDSEQMQKALSLTVAHYPILACQLYTHTGWPIWQRAADKATDIPLIIINTPVRQTIPKFCTADHNEYKTIVARILRGRHSDTLYITVDHTVADMAGTKEIVYTLAAYYAQLERGIRPLPLQQPPPPRDLKETYSEISTISKLTAVCTWRAASGRWHFPKGDAGNNSESSYTIKNLPGQSIAQLKAYCKPYSATINDILIAALFSSLHDLHDCTPGERLPVQFTVDLRRYLWPGRQAQVANLSSSTHVWLHKNPGEHFTQTLRKTHLALADIKQKYPGMGAAIILEFFFKLGFRRTVQAMQKVFAESLVTGMGNPLLINTGLIDCRRLNFGSSKVMNACLIGPSLLVPGLTITASGFRDQLTLSSGFNRTSTRPDYLAQVLDNMTGCLSKVCRTATGG
jgi:NRPS condensation-like uncharacterized protein